MKKRNSLYEASCVCNLNFLLSQKVNLVTTSAVVFCNLILSWRVMKKSVLFMMAIIFFCAMSGAAFAADQTEVKISEAQNKLYVDPQNIHIDGGDILVWFDENWIKTNAIYSDAYGVYVQSDSALGFWECSRCGAMNRPWDFVCRICGETR